MDLYKKFLSIVCADFGLNQDLKLRVEVLKPESDGVRDYLMDEYGEDLSISDCDFILKYAEYLDEMTLKGYDHFELDQDILRERWSPINQIVENQNNHKIYCYFTQDGESCEWNDIEYYVEKEFECNGWCAESFVVSHAEFNDIFSDTTKNIEIDFIGIAQEDMDEPLELIKTYNTKQINK